MCHMGIAEVTVPHTIHNAWPLYCPILPPPIHAEGVLLRFCKLFFDRIIERSRRVGR